ncbi:hypothetical protein C0J45_8101 [Silurus meridionalis]|nr:hypothetical protein C0J45_8101 [Silurus meridionalis]
MLYGCKGLAVCCKVLKVCVILKCESRRHEKRDRTETLTLPELGTTTHPTGNHSRNGKVKIPGSCFLCKTIIKALFNYVRKRYSQKYSHETSPSADLTFGEWFNVSADILHGEFFPQTTQPQYETGMLQESYYVEMTHKKSNHTEDSQFLKCFICKKVVNSIIKRLKRRIQKVSFISELLNALLTCCDCNNYAYSPSFFTVVADSCAVSHEPRMKNMRQNELMSLSDSSPHEQGDDEEQKLWRICHQFVKAYQPLCMSRVMKIHKTVMNFLYPNSSPYDACVKFKMLTFAERGGCFSLMKPEMKNLALSSPSNTRDQLEGQRKISAPPKWQKNPVLCCTCQDFVNTASPKIDLKIQTKINKICNMLIPAMKTKCMRFGANLKRKILLSLFPGKTSRDTFIAHGERWSSDADLQKEFEKIEASLQEAVQGNSTWNIPYKCCMCKESLRLTRFLIMNEMQENLHVFCNLCKTAVYKMMVLVKKRIDQEIKILCGKSKYSRKTCKQQANKYKALLIRWIFHAKNARESCVNMHLC